MVVSAYTELQNWWLPVEGDKYLKKVAKAVVWEVGAERSGLMFVVPRGFLFDVSIPWFLRWLLNPNDESFFKAACLHDYALSLGWRRTTAAGLFEEGLAADGVGVLRRLAMTLAVIVWKFR